MRELFNVAELVRIGVEDETSGVAFYEAMSRKTRNAKLREIFEGMAKEERYHKKRFEEMFESLGAKPAKEEYPGEYTEYLRTLTGTRAFPDPQAAATKAAEFASDAAAIDFAIQFERDTIILMNEMKGLLPESDSSVVNELIREEQSHLVELAEARKLAS